jgi:voltage-gated potassium channel
VTMVIGLLLFALPIGIIANGFVSGLNQRRFAITWSLLKHQPLFADFDVATLNDLMECVKADIVREHGQIIVAGEDATDLFLIVSGTARTDGADGEAVLHSGDIVGPEALHNQVKYLSTVTARSEVRVMAIAHEDLQRLARKNPVLRQRIEAAARSQEGRVGGEPDAAQRLSELAAENQRLKNTLADLLSGKLALQRTDDERPGG